MTNKQDVLANEITDADFSADAFYETYAEQVSEALKKNTSIQNINFSYSNMDDNDFIFIKEALLARNVKMVELNLDSTNLTADSVPNLLELLEAGLIKRLLLFFTDGIFNNQQSRDILSECAMRKGSFISFEHPKKRLSVKTFFENKIEELNDPIIISEDHTNIVEPEKRHVTTPGSPRDQLVS